MDTTANYRISVQGCLDASWSERLGGVSIQVQPETDEVPAGKTPVTVLSGTFRDQAALAGVLDTLYSLGFPLISVEPLGIQPEAATQASDQESFLRKGGSYDLRSDRLCRS